MFESASPFSYSNNLGSSFLDSSLQSMYNGSSTSGLMGQQFAGVMNSISGGVTTGAQNGMLPGMQATTMTPQQIAAQMNTMGPMSVLPYLGNSFMPKLIFPIAGLWSLIDGVRSISAMRSEANSELAATQKFDPSQLNYYKSLEEMYAVSDRWSQLGPLTLR